MGMSRQFRALLTFGAFFAVVWAVLGTLLSVIGGAPILPALSGTGVIFGTIGGMSGVFTALLLARGERGRQAEEVPVWRATLWGFLGGFAPGGGFGVMGAVLGAPEIVLPLMILGGITGVIGGLVSGAAVAAAHQVPGADEPPELPPAE